MTEIIISGACGKMGRVVADLIKGRDDCKVVAGVNQHPVLQEGSFPICKSFPQTADGDVVIDFSNPAVLTNLLNFGKAKHMPIVIATTGYSDAQIQEIETASKEIPIFFTFNMSIGINLLAELCQKAAKVLGTGFDVEIIEKHHNQKVDAPSGTAYMLADAMDEVQDGRFNYCYDRHAVCQKRGKDEIGFHSVRGGSIVGEHEVIFAGKDEVITLSHAAHSRDIFAVGAINAALFLKGKPAGLYRMQDLVK